MTKEDPLYLLNESLATEIESPQTAQATEERSEKAEKWKNRDILCVINKKAKELQPSDPYNTITKKNVKTDLQMCRHTMMKLDENSDPLLSDFIKARDHKRTNSMVVTAWKRNAAAAVIERNNK